MNIKYSLFVLAVGLSSIFHSVLADESTTITTNDGGKVKVTTSPDGHLIERSTPSGSTFVESFGPSGRSHSDMVNEEKNDPFGNSPQGGCTQEMPGCSGFYQTK